jgi:predicted lipoprotein
MWRSKEFPGRVCHFEGHTRQGLIAADVKPERDENVPNGPGNGTDVRDRVPTKAFQSQLNDSPPRRQHGDAYGKAGPH